MKERPVPAEMVAPVEELGEALWALARAEPSATLAALAVGVLGVARAFLPRLLAAAVRANQRTLDPRFAARRAECPGCGGPARRHGWRKRTVLTVCGTCVYERPWYVCRNRGCRRGFSPTDAALGVAPSERVSADLAGWLADAGGRLAFREAALCLGEWAGVAVSPETVRRHTRAAGAALEAAQRERAAELADPRTAAGVASEAPAPGQLVVEVDGVFLRYREPAGGTAWHEVKLGVVGGWVDGRPEAASYAAAREEAGAFGERLAAEAARRGALDVVAWHGDRTRPGVAKLRLVLVLGDGAAWIWILAADRFSERAEIVDLWHAREHLAAAARAALGEGTADAKSWLDRAKAALDAAGAPGALRELGRLRGPSPEARETLRRERAYFRTHRRRMDYPAFRAAGWPVGSGAVEGSAAHLVQARLKRPGCRWSRDGAHAVLQVRCHSLARTIVA